MSNDFVWVEKYRPQTIEDCILPQNVKKTFQDFLDKGEVPNLLLAGPPGCGKTTVAKALCNELGVDVYVINGSDEGRFLDTVRNNAEEFLFLPFRYRQIAKHKVIIIDEQITQHQTYNSYVAFTEEFVKNADSSSPATTKTKSSNPSTPGSVVEFSIKSKDLPNLQPTSSKESKTSWIKRVLSMIQKSLSN